jgi:hypothetical protein
MAAETPDAWDRSALERLGFVGWHRFGDLRSHLRSIPGEAGGVYLVYREADARPSSLATNPGGTWGGDPTVAVDVLGKKWVDGAHVLNIGKAAPAGCAAACVSTTLSARVAAVDIEVGATSGK